MVEDIVIEDVLDRLIKDKLIKYRKNFVDGVSD
jgi:hypothetical protein